MSTAPRRSSSPPPLSPRELDELQALLDAVPAPFEPLDVSMLDGFLCAVLLQPQRVPNARWLQHVTDAEGRVLPESFDPSRLHALVMRRHAELNDAIGRRQWFDPWVFELEAEAAEPADEDNEEGAPGAVDAVYPWVAGFATALEFFPGLMALDAQRMNEPLALLYQHLEPDDLEDADALLAEIEAMEPPADLAEAVESLVRATLLLADVSRPLAAAASRPGPAGKRAGNKPRRF